MTKVKQVNLIFMMSAIMPYIAVFLLGVLNIQIKSELSSLVLTQVIIVTPAIVYLLICRSNPLKALRFKRIKVSNVFLLILFTYLITPVISLVNAISLIFSKNEIIDSVSGITEKNGLLIGLLSAAVIPAIFEEAVFRGVLYNEYHKVNKRVAIFLSALLFGLLHQNLNQFMYAFVIGIIFALVIEATDSIVSTMIIHFFINGTSVVLNYLLPKFYYLMERLYGKDVFDAEAILDTALNNTDQVTMIKAAQTLVVPAIIGGILAFIVYRTIAKNSNRYEEVKKIFAKQPASSEAEVSEGKLRNFISIPLLIGMLICIINIVVLLVQG